jgi:hypothetical protein
MTISVGVAHAENEARWTIINIFNELLKIGPLAPEVQITAIEELKTEKDPGKHLVLLTKSGTNTIALLCFGAELENASGTGAPRLLSEGSTLGRAKFTNCILKVNGITQDTCKPHSKGGPEGTILTELIKGLIVLHELKPSGVKDATLLLTPENSKGEPIENIVTIILGSELESECAVGEKLVVGGELIISDKEFTTEKSTHLFEEFTSLQKLWAFKSDNPATIDGSVIVELANPVHQGLKWAGIPG